MAKRPAPWLHYDRDYHRSRRVLRWIDWSLRFQIICGALTLVIIAVILFAHLIR